MADAGSARRRLARRRSLSLSPVVGNNGEFDRSSIAALPQDFPPTFAPSCLALPQSLRRVPHDVDELCKLRRRDRSIDALEIDGLLMFSPTPWTAGRIPCLIDGRAPVGLGNRDVSIGTLQRAVIPTSS